MSKFVSNRVLVIDENGQSLGAMLYRDARNLAEERGLDLIKVGQNDQGEVHRIADAGKLAYDRKKALKKQHQQHQPALKEMQFSIKIEEHDLQVKVNHINRFIQDGSQVRIIIMMRGRERSHPELARQLWERVLTLLPEVEVLQQPKTSSGQLIVSIKPKNG